MTLAKPAKPKISEAAFQRQVIQLAQMTGWRVAHFRPAQNARGDWRTPVAADGKGFPDLVLVRGNCLLLRELKTTTGRLTKDQTHWAIALTQAANYDVWTPDDWHLIEQTLKRDVRHGRQSGAATP